MSITYSINKQYDGVEIKFTEKPSKDVLEKLKTSGFRWHTGKCVWYAKRTPEREKIAIDLACQEGEQIALDFGEPEATPKQETKPVVEKAEKVEKVIAKAKETAKKKAEAPKVETKKPEAKKDNIVIFPKERPEVKVAITDGAFTYEDCKAKLEEERKTFCDSDSQFVIDGLLKMCEVNQNFRNNVMRPDKTYKGAFQYFADMARKGFALKYDGVTYLDNNIALGFAMDYFNSADVPSNIINGATIVKEG